MSHSSNFCSSSSSSSSNSNSPIKQYPLKIFSRLPSPNPLMPYKFNQFSIKFMSDNIRPLKELPILQKKQQPRLNFLCCNDNYYKDFSITFNSIEEFQLNNQQNLSYQRNSNKQFQSELKFDSMFESGNLSAAYKMSSIHYILFVQNDTNTYGKSTQWYFFGVKGKGTFRISIINLKKSKSLYQTGMKPLIYQEYGGWVRDGFNVTYKRNSFKLYTLSFTYTFDEGKQYYISHSFPYTLSDLGRYLQRLDEKTTISKRLCLTSIQNECPYVTVTSKNNLPKVGIIAISRQHPGETTGSFVMEGLIDFISGASNEAVYLRDKCIFKLIPMMNPDGVVHGNYRTDLNGQDINRCWRRPSKKNTPTVYYTKQLVKKIASEREVQLVLDFHSHSKRLNTFFYGNRDRSSKHESKVFPFYACQQSKMISFLDSRFQVSQKHDKTARVCLWKLLDFNPNVFTVETSFQGYQGENVIDYTQDDLRLIGKQLALSLFMIIFEADGQICRLWSLQHYNHLLGQELPEQQSTSGSESNPSDDDSINNNYLTKRRKIKLKSQHMKSSQVGIKRRGNSMNERGNSTNERETLPLYINNKQPKLVSQIPKKNMKLFKLEPLMKQNQIQQIIKKQPLKSKENQPQSREDYKSHSKCLSIGRKKSFDITRV